MAFRNKSKLHKCWVMVRKSVFVYTSLMSERKNINNSLPKQCLEFSQIMNSFYLSFFIGSVTIIEVVLRVFGSSTKQ